MSKFNRWKTSLAAFLLWTAAAITSPAQTFMTLHSFDYYTDGGEPFAALIQATDGQLYGTTTEGGANFGGTVFKIAASGTLTTVYNFCALSHCTDGYNPDAPLVQATDGNFYGTTFYGGRSRGCGGVEGCGAVFKITSGGTFTTLQSFCAKSNCADGAQPYAGLVQAADGNFYGTTTRGGSHNQQGTIFKVTPSGFLTTLCSFCALSGCSDGAIPYAGLIQATDGNFYGTTVGGGAQDEGAAFKITPVGAVTTLYSFCSETDCADGGGPAAGLVQGRDGNFYGTNSTFFKLTPSGELTTLYTFCLSFGNCPNGSDRWAR